MTTDYSPLIDNAHTILTPRYGTDRLCWPLLASLMTSVSLPDRYNTRHTPNSLFLPGANFHLRNKLGFPFLHCCTLRSTCPTPKPRTCPFPHTLYWPALPLDYRCHVPRGRVGKALPPRMASCVNELVHTERAALAAQLGVRAGSRRLERLVGRAKLLLERGLEGCADCHR